MKQKVVIDAETGQRVCIKAVAPPSRYAMGAGMYSPHSIHDAGVSSVAPRDEITQSRTRRLGDKTGWAAKNRKREEAAKKAFDASLEGVRYRINRFNQTMSEKERQELMYHETDMVKAKYLKQRTKIILAEDEREKQRQVEMRLETSAIGKQRLHRQHQEQRDHYKTQIERINEECELSIADKMIQFGLLR